MALWIGDKIPACCTCGPIPARRCIDGTSPSHLNWRVGNTMRGDHLVSNAGISTPPTSSQVQSLYELSTAFDLSSADDCSNPYTRQWRCRAKRQYKMHQRQQQKSVPTTSTSAMELKTSTHQATSSNSSANSVSSRYLPLPSRRGTNG